MKLQREALVLLVIAAMSNSAPGESDTAIKGSLLVFPAVEVRWNEYGDLVQDTFIEISNDYSASVVLYLFFVQGDPPLPCDAAPNGRGEPGWNWYDHTLALTAHQPVYWSVNSGSPVGFAPWWYLDPGPPHGRPAMDGTNDNVIRGCLYVWAVDPNTYGQIRWNHLSGNAIVVDYREPMAWEYDAVSFQVVDPSVPNGEPVGTPGELKLDNIEYAAPPAELLLKFQAVGAEAFSGGGTTVSSDTDLTLLPMMLDFRLNGDDPVTTKAEVDIWNMYEQKFTGTFRCVTFWDQTLLSFYETPNHWFAENLQTDHGMARIDGIQHAQCSGSVNAPLLGVSARHLIFIEGYARYSRSGSNVTGISYEDGLVQYDVFYTPSNGAPAAPPAPSAPPRPKQDTASDPADRVGANVKGSLLVFPRVEVMWSHDGTQLRQNAFVELANDSDEPVIVRLYFVNGDEPLAADGSERSHQGWNTLTTDLVLTAHQPMYWSALSGEPVGLPPWTDLDPGWPPGRPDPAGSWTRALRGYIYAWAVNGEGEEIRHDHLSGRVTTVDYAGSTGWEHDAFAFQVADPAVAPGQPTGTPGVLHLDGNEFVPVFEMLVMDFQAVGSDAYSGPSMGVATDTSLTVFPVSVDLNAASNVPRMTKADFTVWNEWEVQFTGAHRCLTGWDQTWLSLYGIPNHFFLEYLQTDQGRARIDGQASNQCPGSEDAALLGVAARKLSFGDDYRDTTGSNLVGMGEEAAQVWGGPYLECLIDQDQPSATVYVSFAVPDLAQSFKPGGGNIGGAGCFLQPDVGDTGFVKIELWDALPNAGGTRLAHASTIGRQGTWADVSWPPVSVTPGTTYYLVFTGDETLAITADWQDPYPDGHLFGNEGYQPFPDYDFTFRTCSVVEGPFKYEQALACTEGMYYSNLNHPSNEWMRYDDFVCTQTGDITHITFWGGGYDVFYQEPCDLPSAIDGVEINIYKWEPGGPCDWHAGELLCSNYVPVEDLHPVWRCRHPDGIEEYRLSADLPEPCFQEEGAHYVIRVAADVRVPDAGCIFAWSSMDGTVGEVAFSAKSDETCQPNMVDAAFFMLTDATCPADFDGDGDVDTADLLFLLAAWGTADGDVDGDNDTDTADLLALLAAWGQCP